MDSKYDLIENHSSTNNNNGPTISNGFKRKVSNLTINRQWNGNTNKNNYNNNNNTNNNINNYNNNYKNNNSNNYNNRNSGCISQNNNNNINNNNNNNNNQHENQHHTPKKSKLNNNNLMMDNQTAKNNGHNSDTNHNNNNNNPNSNNKVKHLSIQEQRQSLPAFKAKDCIIAEMCKLETCIVIGETGSGKTTQIPQILYDCGLTTDGSPEDPTYEGIIAITQPRRVAAMTISHRVAKERSCSLGEMVGYTVRFDDKTSPETKIKFITDGSMLREAMLDKHLMKYRCIILDEAHERTINTDILFGIVKEAQRMRAKLKRMPLKIIIMSATMDVDHFSSYFNNCKVLYLEGRTFNVRIFHTKTNATDYFQAILATLFEIHERSPPNHDVLIFLTGQEEIESMAQQIRLFAKANEFKGPPIRVHALYAQLPQTRQLDAFQPTPIGSRKVIISTNIAETSLTINGIKYVIDCGCVKTREYCPITGMEKLSINRISQAQACQRTGRAGRESDGYCYRTYSKFTFDQMSITPKPEILRGNITSTVLQLLSLNIDCQTFNFLDAPKSESITVALRDLNQLGAIKTPSSKEQLTELGKNMAKFPLDPRYSKMLLMASHFQCLEEMLILVAILSGESIFHHYFDNERRNEALNAHAKFYSEYGDHITMLNVFRAFEEAERVKVWCHENFLNIRNLQYANDVREQLRGICGNLDMKLSSCGKNIDQVRKCLMVGLFKNIAVKTHSNIYLTKMGAYKCRIHASSVLANRTPLPGTVLYTEFYENQTLQIRTVTVINEEWIDEHIPNFGTIRSKLL